jgi:hypothetical protein
MTLEESRACLDRAEASLREAAGHLIRFPLDPGRACAALENAKWALEAVRKGSVGNYGIAETAGRVRHEAARVQGLLEAAAGLSLRCFCGAGVGVASYTAAGEFRPDPQAGSLVMQA